MTKKAIKEAMKAAPKFIMYIDYTAFCDKGTEIKPLTATDIISAMDEAEQYKTSEVYLMRIAENTGNLSDSEELIYMDVLCTRSHNWYHNDKTHGENTCTYTYSLGYKYFDFQDVVDWA